MAFTNEQMERYSRHIILQEVGVKGQKKLLNGKVLIIGAGGLGADCIHAAGFLTDPTVDAGCFLPFHNRCTLDSDIIFFCL